MSLKNKKHTHTQVHRLEPNKTTSSANGGYPPPPSPPTKPTHFRRARVVWSGRTRVCTTVAAQKNSSHARGCSEAYSRGPGAVWPQGGPGGGPKTDPSVCLLGVLVVVTWLLSLFSCCCLLVVGGWLLVVGGCFVVCWLLVSVAAGWLLLVGCCWLVIVGG